MALKIRSTANPDLIGDIQPGWSIDENATPYAIGDGSASVGGVQFSAGRRDDSEFLLNKPVTVYYEPEGAVATGNNVTGVFDSVDTSGASVGLTSTSKLAGLTAERSVQPTYNGVAISSNVVESIQNYGITTLTAADTDSSGNYYIVDGTPSNRVFKFDAAGTFLTSDFIVAANLDSNFYILDIAIDKTRDVIFVLFGGPQFTVGRFSLAGDAQALMSVAVNVQNPFSIGIHKSTGAFLIADVSLGIVRFTSLGSYVATYTGLDANKSAVSVDSDSSGNIYFIQNNPENSVNNRIQRLNASGAYLSSWTNSANPLINPKIAVSPTGNIYIIGRNGTPGYITKGISYTNTGVIRYSFAPTAAEEGGLYNHNDIMVNANSVTIFGSNPGASPGGYTGVSYGLNTPAEVSRFTTGAISREVFVGGSGALIANGMTYVINSRRREIARFAPGGKYIDSFLPSATDLPRSISKDSADNIYVFFSSTRTLKVYDRSWNIIAEWSKASGQSQDQLFSAQYAAAAPDGTVYILESSNATGATFGRISKFSQTGTFLTSFGSRGSGAGQFFNAQAIFVDSNYNTWVSSNSEITRWNSANVGISRFAISGGVDSSAGSLFVTGQGIYVAGSGLSTINYYSLSGVLLSVIKSIAGKNLNKPAGVSESGGRLSIYDQSNGRILSAFSDAPLLQTAFEYYIAAVSDVPVNFTGSNPVVTYPGWTDSVWSKLNELCAATGKEIVLQNDSLAIRDISSSQLELTNFVGSPQLSGEKGSSRYIEVISQNTSTIDNNVIFDYRKDRSRTISANVNEYNVTNFETNVWLTSVRSPVVADSQIGLFPTAGTYTVVSSDDLIVPAATWRASGGTLAVTVGQNGTSIDVTINGPGTPIIGYAAPYTVASLVGDGKSTGISVIGSGVAYAPTTQKIATGADWSIVTDDISQTINQPFITTVGAAYDRAEFTAASINGGGQTISFTVPTSDIGGLGLTAGSSFIYGKGRWRIRTSKVGNATISITADLLTTVGEHDARVSGETIGAHDARLAALTLGDSAIKPLY